MSSSQKEGISASLATGFWSLLAVVILLSAIPGCGHAPSVKDQPFGNGLERSGNSQAVDLHGIRFVDTAASRGLDHVLPEQRRPMRILEAFGCGCAAFDFDNDGWQDILLMATPHPTMFRNAGNGTFSDITDACGLAEVTAEKWLGCAVGDYDGDGWLDLVLTGYHRLALCRNQEGRRFVEMTSESGLDPTNSGHWATGAGFMDLDGDQWLDLVSLNFVAFGPDSKQFCEDERAGVRTSCRPQKYPWEKGDIWQNTGKGQFELVPHECGMISTTGVGLVLAFMDIDGDHRIDIYIGNDGVNADMLRNLGGMRFENVAIQSGLAFDRKLTPLAAMGVDCGDFDRDGLLDLTVSNFQNRGFVLFQNLGNSFFSDVSNIKGIEKATEHRLGFGANAFDMDNDGWLDIGYANGHVYEEIALADPSATYRQPVMLMRNEFGRKFTDIAHSLPSEVQRPLVGRGSATLDFDNDGRMDFLIVDYEGPVMLLHNQTQNQNHWITLDLRGLAPNRFAYGAQITATAGDHVWVEQVSPASSYLSSEDPRVHLGLGGVSQLDSIVIRWPSGNKQTMRNVVVDRILRVDESGE